MTDKLTSESKETEQGVEFNIQVTKEISSISDLDNLYHELKETLVTQSNLTSLLKKELKAAFDKHPTVEAIYWHQYTPYFNDGEPCRFRGPYEICVEFSDGVVIDERSESEEEPTEEHESISDDFQFIASLDDEFLLMMFDDHVEVRIDRNMEITVDEYNHD